MKQIDYHLLTSIEVQPLMIVRDTYEKIRIISFLDFHLKINEIMTDDGSLRNMFHVKKARVLSLKKSEVKPLQRKSISQMRKEKKRNLK